MAEIASSNISTRAGATSISSKYRPELPLKPAGNSLLPWVLPPVELELAPPAAAVAACNTAAVTVVG